MVNGNKQSGNGAFVHHQRQYTRRLDVQEGMRDGIGVFSLGYISKPKVNKRDVQDR